MDYISVVKDAIDCIEENIDQKISFSKIADYFFISPFIFFGSSKS